MSFNKKNGHLDFSNVKMSQLGSSQSIRASFSELNSALRTVKTNTILKDAYTHFTQELDVNNNPTKVIYYQANKPVIDELVFLADNNSNLAGKYVILQQFLTKRELVFYFRVGGVGAVPTVGDEQIAVDIEENDPASVVRLNFANAIRPYDEFQVERVGGYTGTSLEITYLQFGETQMLNVTDTGFFVIRRQEGESFEVGEACINYNENQAPIYQGNLLKGMVFNSFTASFEPKEVNSDEDLNSFVESPTRGDGFTAREVLIGNIQELSDAITEGFGTETDVADGTVSATFAVYRTINGVSVGNNSNSFSEASIIGIAINGANNGDLVTYKTSGKLRDSTFNFPINDQLYLGLSGNITNIPPTTGYRTLIGTSNGNGEININIQEPIIL